MKKLAIFAIVMALIAAFSLPAFAYTVEGVKGERFTIGGLIAYDIGYRNIDSDRSVTVPDPRVVPGNSTTYFFNGLSTNTYMFINFTVGDVSGFMSMYTYVYTGGYHSYVDNRIEGPATTYASYSINSTSANYANLNNNFAADRWYGTYTFGNFSIQAGKQDALTVLQVPMAMLGYMGDTGGHIDGIAYGYVYENKMIDIRFNHYVNKNFRWSFQLIAPPTFAEDANPAPAPAPGTPITVGQSSNLNLRESYANYPAVGGLAVFTFGPAMIAPGFYWAQVKWDGLPTGWKDSMTTWFVRLPVHLTFGPFVAAVEGLYGVNIGGRTSNNFTPCASEPSYAMYQRTPSGGITDAITYNLWADLSYTFGPVTPHIYAGMANYSSDYFKTIPGSDNDATRSFYGINVWYKITPNFYIVPEFTIYDLGNVPGIGIKNYKLGKDWLAGAEFRFSF